MSLLLDALRRAEEGARAPAPVADSTAANALARPAADAPSPRAAQTALPVTEARRGGRRIVALAMIALAGAALAGAAAWWLQRPAPTDVMGAAPAAIPEQAPAAGADEAEPAAPIATSPAAPTPIGAGPARRTPTTAERAARPAAAVPLDPNPAAAPATPGAAVRRGEPIEPPLAEAYAAWRAGRLQEAERLYRQALAIDARQPDALLGLAAIAEARGERAEAAEYYRRVLQSEPDHPLALAALAELAAGGDAAAQESVLRQALARRPQAAELHTALGRLLAAQQRWSEAHSALASAWQLDPTSAERAYDLAVALDRLRKPAAAAQMYTQALAQAGPGVGFDVDVARARLAALQASNAAEGR